MTLSDVAPSAPAPGSTASSAPVDSTPDARSSWFLGDQLSVSTVRLIAESTSALTEFGLVGIAAAVDADCLEVLALVGGPGEQPSPLGQQRPLSSWASELERAEDWGDLLFLSGADRAAVHADLASTTGARAWSAGDRVVAALHGSTGEFAGFMWLEQPRPGVPLDQITRSVVEHAARMVGLAVSMAVRRQDLGEQMRLITATRTVVRQASRELDIDVLMEQVCRPLVTGLQARGMWLHVFGEGASRMTGHDQSGQLPVLPQGGEALARRIAENAWFENRVGIVSKSRLRGGLLNTDEVRRVREFLEDAALGSLLFIPMGSGPECLGSVILARDVDESPWSEAEIEVALDLGHDLGRAVLNAASFQKERDLVHRLQALDAHKTTLMRTMSHELKSPLAAIRANLEMLDEVAEADEDARRGLQGASRGARRLANVVDDLLVLAEAGDADRPLAVAPVDLVGLVEDAAELKRTEAVRAGVTICLDIGGDIGADRARADIGADRARADLLVLGNTLDLELLVANLVSNAVKYSPDGGAVTLRLARSHDRVVLTCTDQGIGMSPDDQARIFEEFFRSSHSRARAQPGTGLGLSIVSQIVRRHGGSIDVASSLGAGSTFRVELPAAPTADGTS